uniref:Uncharacterized protein n=1 Tax=Pipistrellus kuhlii TaxID=59472 RepID=A0A7J7VMK1_PIPKU|nr:hypothetical protein mPipKuh1_008449 [Pipistrellus kuhlii]
MPLRKVPREGDLLATSYQLCRLHRDGDEDKTPRPVLAQVKPRSAKGCCLLEWRWRQCGIQLRSSVAYRHYEITVCDDKFYVLPMPLLAITQKSDLEGTRVFCLTYLTNAWGNHNSPTTYKF